MKELSSFDTVTWSFRGRDQAYTFDFLMIEGLPWAPISRVYEVVSHEQMTSYPDYDIQRDVGSSRQMGEIAKMQLPPEWWKDVGGQVWIRCAGVVLLLMKLPRAKAAQQFREQLSLWIEGHVASQGSSQAIAVAQAEGAALTGDYLGMLEQMHQQFGAGLVALRKHAETLGQHGEILDTHSDRIESVEVATRANQQLLADMTDAGFMITDEFLAQKAPDLSSDRHQKNFGFFMSQCLQKQGGYKDERGWVTVRGNRVSKRVPWPGRAHGALNKWRIDFMEWALPKYRESLRKTN